MIEDLGHRIVAMTDNGRSLIELCEVTRPDVIITDNLMADMNGLDAAWKIYQARQTPVVLLSGYCDPKTVRDAEQKHILVYLVKPTSKIYLEAALTRCLDELSVAPHKDAEHCDVQSRVAPATDSRYARHPGHTH